MEGGRRGKVPGWLHIRKKSGHLVRRAPLASRSCCPQRVLGAQREPGSLAAHAASPAPSGAPSAGWAGTQGRACRGSPACAPVPVPGCSLGTRRAPEQPQRPARLVVLLPAGQGGRVWLRGDVLPHCTPLPATQVGNGDLQHGLNSLLPISSPFPPLGLCCSRRLKSAATYCSA